MKLVRHHPKIKPSLQIGLNDAVRETGKNIFLRVFSEEQIKKYFEIETQTGGFASSQEREHIQEDLKEVLEKEQTKVQNPHINNTNITK